MTWRTSVASSYFCARPGAVPRPLAVASGTEEPRLVPARGRLTRRRSPATGSAVDDGDAIAAIKPRHGVIVRRDPRRGDEARCWPSTSTSRSSPSRCRNRTRAGGALRRARGRGDMPVALVLTKADLAPDADLTAAAARAPARRRRGVAVSAAHAARASGSLRHCCPGSDGGTARRLRRRQVDARQRAARRGAPGDGRGARLRRPRPPHHGHPRAARAPGGALLIDTPGIRDRRPLGRHRRELRRRRALALQCRFADCAHDTEPGCAVRKNVDPARLAAWRKLQRDGVIEDRRAAARAREATGREISLHLRRLKK